MRKLIPFAALSLVVSACSDTPTNPLDQAPTIQATIIDGDSNISGEPLCGGLSPCDAYRYDYNGDGVPDGFDDSDPSDGVPDRITVGGADYALGIPGFCFLSPVVENHLSDPACSGEFVSGLTGFELVTVQVTYEPGSMGPPSIGSSSAARISSKARMENSTNPP